MCHLLADGKHAVIERGLATPRICDWNDDGLFDIVCGGAAGGVSWFPNQGERGEPKFGAAQTLVDRSRIQNLPEEEESTEDAYYRNLYAPEKNGWPACPAKSCHIEIVDYDRDGRKDLLLGGQAMLKPEAKELTEVQEKELADLKKKIENVHKEMTAIVEKLGKEEDFNKAISESTEYQEISGQFSELHMKQRALAPEPRQFDLIWFYRNVSGSPKVDTGTASPAGNE
jgi:FG-GAP-like repeat